MRPELPSGTVTFLFTDVEGSTRLLHELGAEGYAEALAEHRRVIREACVAEGGVEVDTQGDAFFFAFPAAPEAVAAAAAFTDALASGPIRVRVGLHTGEPLLGEEGYVGEDVHFAARVAATSHGGQVVLSAEAAALVEDGLVSLGSHRLKDIAEPVVIFQLGDGSFPPLKTIANSNLPTPASSFLGREEELFEADELLRGTRLLTVSGPGGVGKTRFALELARRARKERFSDYPDGVFSCFLSSLRDPTLVLPTVAQALSVTEQPGQSALGALSSHLQGKRMLLLLDNAEHLLDAASELSQLLEAASGLTLLVTSRELLRIRGETTYELPQLPEEEAVALFCERAQVEPSEPIRELCARLEGLPLALELAAARLRILTPEQLLERLSKRLDVLKAGRDVEARQTTLRATIEWSFDLLTPKEQQLFARLSVFAGGCTLDAAEEVAEADLDSLQSLVEKSLLRLTDERYWMLATIREYAGERLDEDAGSQETLRLHADWFIALLENAERELEGRDQRAWLVRLDAEQDNVRAALRWALDASQAHRALRLAGACGSYWWIRGQATEGRGWLEAALALPSEGDPQFRSRALEEAAHLAFRQADYSTARLLADRSIDLARSHRDTGRLARKLRVLALVAVGEGDQIGSRALIEQSATAARESGDAWALMMALNNLGCAALDAGDPGRASVYLEEAVEFARSNGDERGEAFVLENLAFALLVGGEREKAHADFARSLQIAHRLGFMEVVAMDLTGIAAVTTSNGDGHRAALMLGAAERLLEEIGTPRDVVEERVSVETLASLERSLGTDGLHDALDDGRRLALDDAVDLALASLD